MESELISRGEYIPHDRRQDIEEVIAECKCTRKEAISCLNFSDDSPAKAIRRFHLLMKYAPGSFTEDEASIHSEDTRTSEGMPSDHESIEHDETLANDEEFDEHWNFDMAIIRPPPDLTNAGHRGFKIENLVSAVQHGMNQLDIEEYLEFYDKDSVENQMDEWVDGIPSIFFAVASNHEWAVRLWASYGADLLSVHRQSQMPLLAFAILNRDRVQADTTHMVTTLLSLGADPTVFPEPFYTPCDLDMPEDFSGMEKVFDLTSYSQQWCRGLLRLRLAKTANITQRYYLHRAATTMRPGVRYKQIAELKDAQSLLGLPYFLVGQNTATDQLLKEMICHMLLPSAKPLVLVFGGQSGHGKTELARGLGNLMSLPMEIVGCTVLNHETDLFGPRHPFVNAEVGTPLNNFLATNAGERCIVFFDEFEKTTQEIHQALLLPFDKGEYQDRRDLSEVNCAQTIWIIATNALDPTIKQFCTQHRETIYTKTDNEEERASLMKELGKELKETFLQICGAPLTGRISHFLPFLPFSLTEQAVIVHKYLLDLDKKARLSVNLSQGPHQNILGNVRLRIRHDASVCRILAKEFYHPDLGARSLIGAVDSVKKDLAYAYADVPELIKESGETMEFVIDVCGGKIETRMVTLSERTRMNYGPCGDLSSD